MIVDRDLEAGDVDWLRGDGFHVVCDDGMIVEYKRLVGGVCIDHGVVQLSDCKPGWTFFVPEERLDARTMSNERTQGR